MTSPDETDNTATQQYANTVVIGVGGSGVQVVSRLRAAVRDRARPSQSRLDGVAFLGIDALEMTSQYPALPKGVGLADDEFINVAGQVFNPAEYVRAQLQSNGEVSKWFDPTYEVPNEPIVHALARSRMLGHLAFDFARHNIERAVKQAIDRARHVRPMDQGAGGGVLNLDVFIVASCVGGTGSSGFLPVLAAVHKMSKDVGPGVKVWPVIMLPGVFGETRATSSDPAELERAHEANAYAFFRELDHVISVPGALDRYFTPDGELPIAVDANGIAKCVFVVDAQLHDGTTMGFVSAFQLVSSALYELIMTDLGAPQLGAKGTNVLTQALVSRDVHDKRTAYASFGLQRIVFPKSTYKRYLTARLRAGLLHEVFVGPAGDTGGALQESKLVKSIVDVVEAEVLALQQKADNVTLFVDMKNDAADMASTITGEEVTDPHGQATQEVSNLTTKSTQVRRALDDRMNGAVEGARIAIIAGIDQVLRDSGCNARVLELAMEKAQVLLKTKFEESRAKALAAERTLNLGSQGNRNDGESMNSALSSLEAATHANIVRRMIPGSQDKAIAALTRAATDYVNSVRQVSVADAEETLVESSEKTVRRLAKALKSSRMQLEEMAGECDSTWADDELSGKDAGPFDLTGYVPRDVRPDVETSDFAKRLWDAVSAEVSSTAKWKLNSAGWCDGLKAVYTEWWENIDPKPSPRGIVGLGIDDSIVTPLSRERLEQILDEIETSVTSKLDLWPTDLFDAAKQTDATAGGNGEAEHLQTAVSNLLGRSRNVAVGLDMAQSAASGNPMPPPLQIVGAGKSIWSDLPSLPDSIEVVDSNDPDQIIALSLEFGFAFHTVRNIERWQQEYRHVNKRRAAFDPSSKRADPPPPHLDRRFAAELQELRPRATISDVAKTVVEASLIHRLLLDDECQALLANINLDTRPPIRRFIEPDADFGDEVRYEVDTVFISDNDRPMTQRTDSYRPGIPALMDGLAENPGARTGIAEFFDRVRLQVRNSPDLLASLMTVSDQEAQQRGSDAQALRDNPMVATREPWEQDQLDALAKGSYAIAKQVRERAAFEAQAADKPGL